MTQSNQTANYFARKWISRIFRFFRPENCKQRRVGEIVENWSTRQLQSQTQAV